MLNNKKTENNYMRLIHWRDTQRTLRKETKDELDNLAHNRHPVR